jgi:hypothetical protein
VCILQRDQYLSIYQWVITLLLNVQITEFKNWLVENRLNCVSELCTEMLDMLRYQPSSKGKFQAWLNL